MLRIITDTSCDISLELANKLGIEILPLTVRFGEESYKTLYELPSKEFHDKLKASKELPKTAQINPFEFEEKFKEILDAGDEAVGIFISSELSGTFQSAKIALDNVDTDKIDVIDSLNASGAVGVLAIAAAKMRDEGKSREEIVAKIKEYVPRTKLFIILDTLEYLKKGGRINPAVAFVGEAIKLRPIITVVEGKVEVADKAKGDKAGNKRLREKLSDFVPMEGSPIIVGHADAIERAEALKEDIVAMGYDVLAPEFIGAVVGTYTGPNAVGVFYIAEK